MSISFLAPHRSMFQVTLVCYLTPTYWDVVSPFEQVTSMSERSKWHPCQNGATLLLLCQGQTMTRTMKHRHFSKGVMAVSDTPILRRYMSDSSYFFNCQHSPNTSWHMGIQFNTFNSLKTTYFKLDIIPDNQQVDLINLNIQGCQWLWQKNQNCGVVFGY